MAIWDDVKKITMDLAHTTADVSKKLADITKLNMNNSRQEDNIKHLYLEIGKQYYDAYCDDPGADFKPLCDRITVCKQIIDENNRQIAALKSNFKKEGCSEPSDESEEVPVRHNEDEISSDSEVPSAAEAAEVFEEQLSEDTTQATTWDEAAITPPETSSEAPEETEEK